MSTTWILVANARQARLYANHGPNKGLELVEEANALPESKTERSSRMRDNQQQLANNFADQLVDQLYYGRSRGDYARAIIVAPPQFMGMLNARLDKPTAQLISSRLDKDYTKTPQNELCAHLSSCLCV